MSTFTDAEKDVLKQRLAGNMQMLRAKLGISQSKLAETLGVSRQTINSIENGRQKMSWSLFITLVLYFSHNKDTRVLLPAVKIDMRKIEQYFLNDEERID